MARGKYLHGEKPWEDYGLTRSAYYSRKQRGIPFDKQCRRGRQSAKPWEAYGLTQSAYYSRKKRGVPLDAPRRGINGEKPWEKYGLAQGTYYDRKRKGIPFDKPCTRGRKKSPETLELERLKESQEKNHRKEVYGRFSGKKYENSPERLAEIREKYKNGITPEIMKELAVKLFGEA